MKPKTLLLLAVAGGCGLVAMLFVQQAMQGRGQAKVETGRVLVAIADIEAGVKLSDANVAFRDLAIPEGGFAKDVVVKPEDYADRSPKTKLFAGDVITLVKLNEPGISGRSTVIPKGMRVMTINVNDTHTQSGLMQPGDRVDVLVTYQGKDPNTKNRVTKVKTLLEYVEVFATDDRMVNKTNDGSESGKAKNVSLLLTPEQTTYVTVAQSKGQLGLLWRNKADDEIVQTGMVNEELFDELKGTAGMNDPVPLYGDSNEELMADDVAQTDPGPTDPGTPAQFLDNVDHQPPAATTPVAVVEPVKPKWVMEVYSGAQPTQAEFEIPEAPAPPQPSGLLGDMMKQFWNGGKSGASAPKTQTP
jgi:pilus assembly protein CpaB